MCHLFVCCSALSPVTRPHDVLQACIWAHIPHPPLPPRCCADMPLLPCRIATGAQQLTTDWSAMSPLQALHRCRLHLQALHSAASQAQAHEAAAQDHLQQLDRLKALLEESAAWPSQLSAQQGAVIWAV